MKYKLKSVFITAGGLLLTGFILAGCDNPNGDSTYPHVFGGIEVPNDVMNEPRVVTVPPPQDFSSQPYPQLGAVPPKPGTFSPQPVLDQAHNELRFDRAQAQKIEKNYLNPPPGEPVPAAGQMY